MVVGWRRPTADGDIDEMDADRFRLLAFPSERASIFAAKIDDGGDAEFFELYEPFGVRLSAAEEGIVYFSSVGQA